MESRRSATNVPLTNALRPHIGTNDNNATREILVIVLSDSTAPPYFSGLNDGSHPACNSIHSPSVTFKILEKHVAFVLSKVRQKQEKSDWGSPLKGRKKIVKSWVSLEKERSDREFRELNKRPSGGCLHTHEKREQYRHDAKFDSDGFSIFECQDYGSKSDSKIERLFDCTSEFEV